MTILPEYPPCEDAQGWEEKSNADEKDDKALELIGLEKRNNLWTLETLPLPEELFDPSEALGEKRFLRRQKLSCRMASWQRKTIGKA